jgi:hypothetical protein
VGASGAGGGASGRCEERTNSAKEKIELMEDSRIPHAEKASGQPLAAGTNLVAKKSRRGTYSRSTTRECCRPRECGRKTTIIAADNGQKGRRT